MYSIDKTVPLPPLHAKTKKYPFPEMEIGDSIFVPEAGARSARNAVNSYAKKAARKFATRAAFIEANDDYGNPLPNIAGIRIWRTA